MSRKHSTQSEKNSQVVMATIVPNSNSNSNSNSNQIANATDQKQVVMGTIIPDPNQFVTDLAQYQNVQNSSNLPESVRAFLSAVKQAQEHTIQLLDSIQADQVLPILTQQEYAALILENEGLNRQLTDLLNLYKQEIIASGIAYNSLISANSNNNFPLFLENYNIMKRTARTIPEIIAHTEHYMQRVLTIREIFNKHNILANLSDQNYQKKPESMNGLNIISSLNSQIFGNPSFKLHP
jgi:hypothetical protein